MGKADLKVTVGLLLLGLALGVIVLRAMNPPPTQRQQATAQQGIVRPMNQTSTAPAFDDHPAIDTEDLSVAHPHEHAALPEAPAGEVLAGSMPPLTLPGSVLRVSPQEQTITIGNYRIEHNKAVLAAQQTIGFTDETLFVRAFSAGSEQLSETAITSQDIHEHDPVAIIASRRSAAGQPVAEKIILLGDLAQPGG